MSLRVRSCALTILVGLGQACSAGSSDDAVVADTAGADPNQDSSNLNTAGEDTAVEDQEPPDQPVTDGSRELTPVFVTIAGHIEDSPAYANCERYPSYRRQLLAFADVFEPTGVPFNLQIDFNFLRGVHDCENAQMQERTEGLNLLEYLVARKGFEIDPHEEGGWEDGVENYADVRFLGGQVTAEITETAGGVVWDFPDQFAALTDGEIGRIYTDFTWRPEVITLAVYSEHHHGDFSQDDLASGVWLPAGTGDDFWVHDDGGRLIYVAPGHQHSNWFGGRECFFESGADYVETLVDYLERGVIPTEKIYTSTIAVPQSIIFEADDHQKLLDVVDQLEPLVEAGKVEFVHFTDVVEIWRTRYDSEPNIFLFDEISPSDYTCE